MGEPMKSRNRVILLLVLLLASAATLLALFFRDVKQGDLAFEVAKALLQLGVVGVAGAAVTLAMNATELDRQRLEYRDELLDMTLRHVVTAYANVKKARRLLRARVGIGSGGPGLVRIDDYDRYLELVNEAQLGLENLKGDVQTSARAFSYAEVIGQSLTDMEGYLGRLVKEYEAKRQLVTQNPAGLPFTGLPRLSDFLAQATPNGRF